LQGKVGDDLAATYERQDLALKDVTHPKAVMYPEGDLEYLASLNSLTYGKTQSCDE
jgi:hypothetical protein